MNGFRCLIFVIGLVALAGTAQAGPISYTVSVDVTHQYDWATQTYLTVDIPTTVTVTLSDKVTKSALSGNVVTTTYSGGTTISSSLTSMIPSASDGTTAASVKDSSFAFVYDYPTDFIQELRSQGNLTAGPNADKWSYNIMTSVRRDSAPRLGTGASAFAFTPDDYTFPQRCDAKSLTLSHHVR
jgi:hypothetical protein